MIQQIADINIAQVTHKVRHAKGRYWRYNINDPSDLEVWQNNRWEKADQADQADLQNAEKSPWV